MNELLDFYDSTQKRFEPHIQEEFLVGDTLDCRYLGYKFDKHLSVASCKSQASKLFGNWKFQLHTNENEVSEEEFFAEYKFGKYLNVREWIGHMYAKTGKLLTKQKLFKYILSTSKKKQHSVMGGSLDVSFD